MEQWKNIEGYPGYMVSSSGRVGSYKTFQGTISTIRRILKPRINPNGYSVVVLYDVNHEPHQLLVHRLVAKAFKSIQDDSLVVDHLDSDKSNNRADNLEWVTSKENSIRAFKAGLYDPIFRVTKKPVLVTDIWTGEERYYSGVNEAARDLGYSPAIISRAANLLHDKVGHYIIELADNDTRLLYLDTGEM